MIVFCIIFICTATFSIIPMDKSVDQRIVHSLTNLCINHIAERIQLPNELANFEHCPTNYSGISADMRKLIAKKLPILCSVGYVNRSFSFSKIAWNPSNKDECIVDIHTPNNRLKKNRSGVIVTKKIIDIFTGQEKAVFKPDVQSAWYDKSGVYIGMTMIGAPYSQFHGGTYFSVGSVDADFNYQEKWAGQATAIEFTTNSSDLIVRGQQLVDLVNIKSNQKIYNHVNDIQECPFKNWLLINRDNQLTILNSWSKKKYYIFFDVVRSAISLKGKRLFTIGTDGSAKLINLSDLSLMTLFVPGNDRVGLFKKAQFSEDENYILLNFFDGDIYCFDLLGNKKMIIKPWKALFIANILHLSFCRNGIISDPNRDKCFFPVEDVFKECNRNKKNFFNYSDFVKKPFVNSDDEIAVSADSNYFCRMFQSNTLFKNCARIIDFKSRKPIKTISGAFKACCFNPASDTVLLSACEKNRTVVIRLLKGLTIEQFLLRRLIETKKIQKDKDTILENPVFDMFYDSVPDDQKRYFIC